MHFILGGLHGAKALSAPMSNRIFQVERQKRIDPSNPKMNCEGVLSARRIEVATFEND